MSPVLYKCTGLNEHGARCGKLLLVWKPPVVNGVRHDFGQIEVKCRRCRTMNYIRPVDAVPNMPAVRV